MGLGIVVCYNESPGITTKTYLGAVPKPEHPQIVTHSSSG